MLPAMMTVKPEGASDTGVPDTVMGDAPGTTV